MTLVAQRHAEALPQTRRSFLDDDWQLVVLDDFLSPERIARLAAHASDHTGYEIEYGLMPVDDEGWEQTRGRHVDRAEYEAAPAAQHYYRFGSSRFWSYKPGQRRLDPSCPFALDELDALLSFVRSGTGYQLGKIRCVVRRFGPGDFIGDHHQNRLDRVLTAHLPLTADPGEELVLQLYGHDGRSRRVPLTFNSFSWFDLRARWREAVPRRTAPAPVDMVHFWFYA